MPGPDVGEVSPVTPTGGKPGFLGGTPPPAANVATGFLGAPLGSHPESQIPAGEITTPGTVSGDAQRPTGDGGLPQDLVDAARAEVSTQAPKPGRGLFGRLFGGGGKPEAPVSPPVAQAAPSAPVEVSPVPPIDSSTRAREIDEMIREATADKPAIDVRIPGWMRKPEPSAIPVAPEPPLAQAAEPPAQLSETPLVLPTEQGAYGSVASERSAAVSRAMSEAEAERTRRLRTEPITFTRRPGAREREAEQTKHFFSDARIRDGISEAVKKITGRLPNKEQIEKLAKGAGRKVSKAKVLGQPLPDFIAGAVLGGGAKQLARTGLAIAGVGGFGIAAGAGAVGGLAVEYYKLRKTVDMGETSETKGIRQGLKNELARLKAADRTKLRNAAIRGAISGAVGGVVGGLIMDHVDWGNIVHHVPGIGAAPGSPDIPQLAGAPAPGAGEAVAPTPSGTPTPGAEGITAPTPGAGVVETMPPAGPSTPEIPAGVGEEIVPAPEAGVAEAVTPAGPSSPPIAEVPETPEVESPMDISPKELATPPGPETIEIPAGSNPWVEVDKYLTDKLGRPPTTDEIERSVASLLSDNGIVDATKIPAGTVLNVEGVNQHIGEILGSAQLIPPDIAVLSESLPLPVNSDPWAEVSTLLEDLGRSHTNPEILGVARELCIQSKISVPEWGIVGDFDHRNLPAGFMLNFNDEVKRKIAQLALAS